MVGKDAPRLCPCRVSLERFRTDRMALKSTIAPTRLASVAEFIGIDPRELEHVFVCEDWTADLATGLVRLGPETANLHGTAGMPCGIMDLVRLYDPADWQKVLQALENAATVSTVFTFATTIRPGPGLYRPVFCFGQSETTNGTGGTIHGTFAVARLYIETASGRPATLN
jgi:hypothetical protein